MSISNEVRVDDDEAGASPADPGRRRSPVRRVVIVVVALVAVAALAAAGVWATMPRLDHSGSVWGSLYEDTARFPAENLAVVVTDPTGPDDTAYAWDIRNDGPFPVTVASKTAAGEIHDLRRAGVLLTRVAPEGGTVTTGEPVRSLRLEPGERVKIEARPMWACGSSDGSVMCSAGVAEGISTIDVDVTTLGVTRTQTLQIPQTLFLMTTTDLSPGAAWGC